MPKDIQENLVGKKRLTGRFANKNDVDERSKRFESFLKKVDIKSVTRKPVKTVPKNIIGTLGAKRNKRLTIRESALRGVTVVITYKKVTTNETKRYEVLVLSYRYKRLRAGYRKVLFAQDVRENKQIKLFVLRNILNVKLTDRKLAIKGHYGVEIV